MNRQTKHSARPKATLPKIGPPIQSPGPESLKKLTVEAVLGEDVRRILTKCGAPKDWGEKELKWFVHFGVFRQVSDHDTFNYLLAIAPDATLKALPKVWKFVRNAWYRPTFRIALEQALNPAAVKGLWDKEAKVIAGDFDKAFQLGRTPAQTLLELVGKPQVKPVIKERHIEDARQKLRKLSRKT